MKSEDKEILINMKTKSLSKARSSMGTSESFYDPYVLVSRAFTEEELKASTEKEIAMLLKLADFASDVFSAGFQLSFDPLN